MSHGLLRNRTAVSPQTGTPFKGRPEHFPLLSLAAPRPKLTTPLPSDTNPTQPLQQQLRCTANSHRHPLMHSNFKNQPWIRMSFQTLIPHCIFFTGSFLYSLVKPTSTLAYLKRISRTSEKRCTHAQGPKARRQKAERCLRLQEGTAASQRCRSWDNSTEDKRGLTKHVRTGHSFFILQWNPKKFSLNRRRVIIRILRWRGKCPLGL